MEYAPPLPTPARVPPQRAVAPVPNPVRPKLVRDIDPSDLMDLFAVFPELPYPPRPRRAMPLRMAARLRRLR